MRAMIERLPSMFRTRRGFAALIGIVAFFGYGGWSLTQGKGIVLSLVAGVTSGFVAFLFFWFVFSRAGTGFDD
jgi:fucose permease